MDTHNFHSALNEHRRIMMPVERLENASSHLNPGITQNLDSQTAKIEHHIESDQVAGAVRSKERGARGIGVLLAIWWRFLLCTLSNLRRRMLRRRLADYAVFELHGELIERIPETPWWRDLLPGNRQPLSLEYLENALTRIADDPDVKGAVFLLCSPALTLAQAQSLAALFTRFRQMNVPQPKQIVAFIEETNAAGYVAACAADRIYMTPLSEWNIVGLRVGGLYLKDALKRIGVAFDVVRVSPWKTAGDMFHDATMSDESRAQFNWLLDSLFADIVSAISQGRKLSKQTVCELIDQAPLGAERALAADLVDGLAYEDELPLLLGRNKQPATLKPYDKVKRLLWRTLRKPGRGAVGVISLEGAIMMGSSRNLPLPLPLVGGQQMGHQTVQQQLRDARQNEWLDAVVLHIDSPGGSALASDLMWREIDLLCREKPVIVYMGNVAASGGYYIAAPGAKIVAQSATLTGSIGVINMKPITEDALQKVSVHRQFLQRGANADILGEDKHWDAKQLEQMKASVQHIYREFKERVAAGRHLDYASLDPICNGRVWTGAQAKTHGLVDEVGDMHTALELACTEAGLNLDEVRVINLPTPKDKLPAEPLAEVLGVRNMAHAQKMLLEIAQGNWAALWGNERVWLLADNLPKIEG